MAMDPGVNNIPIEVGVKMLPGDLMGCRTPAGVFFFPGPVAPAS